MMKIAKHMPVGILLIWLNIPWSAVLSQQPVPGEQRRDNREVQQSDAWSFLRSREWLGSLQIKAWLRLRLWEQQNQWASQGEQFYIRHPDLQHQLLRLEIDPRVYATNFKEIPGYDFRQSTAYRTDYARGFVIPEHSKHENVLRVSPFTFFPAVFEEVKKVRAAVIQPSKESAPAEGKIFAPPSGQGGSED